MEHSSRVLSDFSPIARKILETVSYASLATASAAAVPWNSPVFVAYDRRFTFYWISSPEAQHSRNIRENGKVFLVIYDSTARKGTGYGVYIAARAMEISEHDEMILAINLIYERKGESPKPVEDFSGDIPRRIYRAVPEKIWINTDGQVNGHHVDARVEVNLGSL